MSHIDLVTITKCACVYGLKILLESLASTAVHKSSSGLNGCYFKVVGISVLVVGVSVLVVGVSLHVVGVSVLVVGVSALVVGVSVLLVVV